MGHGETIDVNNKCLKKVVLKNMSQKPTEVSIPESINCDDLQDLTIVISLGFNDVTVMVVSGPYAPGLLNPPSALKYEAKGMR